MKRVLLINTNMETNPYPVPPLGLCLVAESIKNNYEVILYNKLSDENSDLKSVINEFKPDYIGVSIRNVDDMRIYNTTYYVQTIYNDFIKPVKETTEVPIILGGSGFSIFPMELMKEFNADYGIVGEGEYIFPLLLDHLDNEKDISKLPSVITKDTFTFNAPYNNYDIKLMPFANIGLNLNFSHYKERGAYSIQTKRGCYHKCIYCTYPSIEGSVYRAREAKEVANEIAEAYHRDGITAFEFVDSTFNDPPGHAEEICREIIKHKIKVSLRTMGINPSHASKELFDLMMQAGFSQIDCTPDTASPIMIENLEKNFTLKELENTAQIIKEYNIPTMWFFIFGGPGETENTFKESLDFIDKWVNTYDMVHVTLGLRVYPNTRLYDISVSEGVLNTKESILYPKFYISPKIGEIKLKEIIQEASTKRPNFIPGYESTPPASMLKEASRIRKELKLNEPMFRTLLRLRYMMFEKIKYTQV